MTVEELNARLSELKSAFQTEHLKAPAPEVILAIREACGSRRLQRLLDRHAAPQGTPADAREGCRDDPPRGLEFSREFPSEATEATEAVRTRRRGGRPPFVPAFAPARGGMHRKGLGFSTH